MIGATCDTSQRQVKEGVQSKAVAGISFICKKKS